VINNNNNNNNNAWRCVRTFKVEATVLAEFNYYEKFSAKIL
jgi:hypothetical protein